MSLHLHVANTSTSEVGHAAVAIEVIDEFLGWHRYELGVEARLRVSWASFARASLAGAR
jgi:hypothetical protein